MALSRCQTLRSALRVPFSSTSAAAAAEGFSPSLLQTGHFGSQVRNRFFAREVQSQQWKDGGLLSWLTRRMASYGETTLRSNMTSVGEDVYAKKTLTSPVTKKLGSGGDYQRFLLTSSMRGQNQYPFAASGILSSAGNRGPTTQQIRRIMVEVRKNDLERAIRRWRRKCKEENLRSLKDREYYIKPSEKRVLAKKERDHRIAKRAFKQKLNWIMSRRQRGF